MKPRGTPGHNRTNICCFSLPVCARVLTNGDQCREIFASVSVTTVNYKELPDAVNHRFNSHLKFASRHQFLDQMPKAKVLQLLCFGRLVTI